MSACRATVDRPCPKGWNWCVRADLRFKKRKKKVQAGIDSSKIFLLNFDMRVTSCTVMHLTLLHPREDRSNPPVHSFPFHAAFPSATWGKWCYSTDWRFLWCHLGISAQQNGVKRKHSNWKLLHLIRQSRKLMNSIAIWTSNRHLTTRIHHDVKISSSVQQQRIYAIK